MANPRNSGNLVGRLAADPKVYTNSDNSHKVLMTVFVDRNYTDRQGERLSDGIPVEAFVSSRVNGIGPYSHVHKGDLVALQTNLQHQRYEKGGQTVYETKVIVEEVTFLESRTVTEARLAQRASTNETPAGPEATPPVAMQTELPSEGSSITDQQAF